MLRKDNKGCNKCPLLSQSVRRYCRCNKQNADGNINDHLLSILHSENRIRTSFNALHVYQKRKVKMYSMTHKRKIGIQVGCAAVERKEIGVQSYGRRNIETSFLTYDELLRNHLWTKDYTMEKKSFLRQIVSVTFAVPK